MYLVQIDITVNILLNPVEQTTKNALKFLLPHTKSNQIKQVLVAFQKKSRKTKTAHKQLVVKRICLSSTGNHQSIGEDLPLPEPLKLALFP